MREFMDHITHSFFKTIGWNRDNSYSELNATANGLLDFVVPDGLRVVLSSLATPHFSTCYQLGAVGVVDGSIAYLYSSVPLHGVISQSDRMPLSPLLRSYRQLNDLGLDGRQSPLDLTSLLNHPLEDTRQGSRSLVGGTGYVQQDAGGVHGGVHGTLLYGCLYLPRSTLHARIIQQLTPALQMQVAAVSSEDLRNGGTILGSAHYDRGKFNIESLASTDGGLLGVRSLYNFGGDASPGPSPTPGTAEESNNGQTTDRERIYGRFSAGGELYYGALNKSAGMSLGGRFATLPSHPGTPLTATLTINPLMGNISATYAVLARQYCSLATQMDFNVHSYDSEWKIGMELWSKRRPGGFLLGVDPSQGSSGQADKSPPDRRERSFQAKMEWRLDDLEPVNNTKRTPGALAADDDGEHLGVLKARLDQHLGIGLLWEGRIKSLIFSLGTNIDLRRRDQPFRSVGLVIQYSS